MFKKFEEYRIQYADLLEQIHNKEIPVEFPKSMITDFNYNTFMLRDLIIKEQGFALISKNWISKLANWIGDRKCLELMSGCGALSYALQQEGVNIRATDNFSWCGGNESGINYNWKHYCDVENIDCVEAVEKYGKDTNVIIISWAYMDDNAYKCLLKMREVNPFAVMIFIGEGDGGCTADEKFYDSINEIEDTNIDSINAIYPRWSGIYDRLWLVR